MVERNALCFVLTDKGLGRCGGFGRGRIVVFPGFALRLDDSSGHRIYLILVFIARRLELYLVDIDAVVTVKLYLIVPYLACGYTGMVERNALCFVLTDKGLGRCGGFGRGRIVVFPGFALRLDDSSGHRIYLILVLIARRLELNLVDINSVVTVKLYLVVTNIACGYSGMAERNALCLGLAD